MSRAIQAHYVDPLAHIWLSAAAELGLKVTRGAAGYATTDGRGTLLVAQQADLDADDCLAQIIFHEICHALVQGEASFSKPDWGLVNDIESASYGGDTVREEACLRLQAALLRPYGLRRLLAPTTEFRSFYDALPRDPLIGSPNDAALPLAWEGVALAFRAPYRRILTTALQATLALFEALPESAARYDAAAATDAAGAPVASPEAPAKLPSLWRVLRPPARHAGSGLPMSDGIHAAPARTTCAECAFCSDADRRKGERRCHRTAGAESGDRAALSSRTQKLGRPVRGDARACTLFHARPELDCQRCAACCRHAYDLVEVSRSERLVARRPELIEQKGRQLRIRRDPRRRCCAALASLEPSAVPKAPTEAAVAAGGVVYRCTVYEDRPATCRDFSSGSPSCLEARRRVGFET